MNGKLIIWAGDETALYTGDTARGSDKKPAVQWLETVFTGRWALATFHNPDLVPGPDCIRPMIELIDQEQDAAEDDHGPMVIGQADYDDPGRWWL